MDEVSVYDYSTPVHRVLLEPNLLAGIGVIPAMLILVITIVHIEAGCSSNQRFFHSCLHNYLIVLFCPAGHKPVPCPLGQGSPSMVLYVRFAEA